MSPKEQEEGLLRDTLVTVDTSSMVEITEYAKMIMDFGVEQNQNVKVRQHGGTPITENQFVR